MDEISLDPTGFPVERPVPPDHRSGFVALVGRANVGKSTLLNQLVGRKVAIVSAVPQTTRTRVLDPARESRPVLMALNKVDLMNKGKLLPMIERAVSEFHVRDVVPVSALSGDNCDELLKVATALLPLGPPLYPDDFVTDQDDRRFVAEIIREKLLVGLRQEVPHSVAVAIERMERRDDGLAEIHAAILVERDSQKAIVIGAHGARLKEVGTKARLELESVLGTRVFLRLWVKVREDWRDKISVLRELGMYPE